MVSRWRFSEARQGHERLCSEHEERAFREGESRTGELFPSFRCLFHGSCYTGFKKAGTASVSLVGNLLEDYEATGAVDPDHEDDIKLVGAAMYAGKCLRDPQLLDNAN